MRRRLMRRRLLRGLGSRADELPYVSPVPPGQREQERGHSYPPQALEGRPGQAIAYGRVVLAIKGILQCAFPRRRVRYGGVPARERVVDEILQEALIGIELEGTLVAINLTDVLDVGLIEVTDSHGGLGHRDAAALRRVVVTEPDRLDGL